MKLFLKYAGDKKTVFRSIKVALVVGTLLGLINHYGLIFSGNLTVNEIIQIGITYLVPYSVATFGAASQAKHTELARIKN